jgi:hypothetical protein
MKVIIAVSQKEEMEMRRSKKKMSMVEEKSGL